MSLRRAMRVLRGRPVSRSLAARPAACVGAAAATAVGGPAADGRRPVASRGAGAVAGVGPRSSGARARTGRSAAGPASGAHRSRRASRRRRPPPTRPRGHDERGSRRPCRAARCGSVEMTALVGRQRRVLADQRGQGLARPDLEQDRGPGARRAARPRRPRSARSGERAGPSSRGRRVSSVVDPGASHRADHRDPQRARGEARDVVSQRLEHGLHHRRVERPVGGETAEGDVARRRAAARAPRSTSGGPDATHCSGALTAASEVCVVEQRDARPMRPRARPSSHRAGRSCMSRPRATARPGASSSVRTPPMQAAAISPTL